MKKTLKLASLFFSLATAVAFVVSFSAAAQNTTPKSASTAPPAVATTQAKPGVKTPSAPSKAGTTPSAQESVQYKDPEDMTTRYRPGNNKTTSAPAGGTLPPTAPTGSPAATTDAKKHISNVKYDDRQATVPALDAASKDAAKSKVAPPTTSNASQQGASTTQDATRKNKVDSFTVKQ